MKLERPAKTPLVNAICDAIRKIPRGRVSTYGAIAAAAGYPRCARHVGRVLQQVDGLPWHRVLGSGGRSAMPGEFALEQRFRLESEGVRFRGKRVDMRNFEHRFGKTSGQPSAFKGDGKDRRLPRK